MSWIGSCRSRIGIRALSDWSRVLRLGLRRLRSWRPAGSPWSTVRCEGHISNSNIGRQSCVVIHLSCLWTYHSIVVACQMRNRQNVVRGRIVGLVDVNGRSGIFQRLSLYSSVLRYGMRRVLMEGAIIQRRWTWASFRFGLNSMHTTDRFSFQFLRISGPRLSSRLLRRVLVQLYHLSRPFLISQCLDRKMCVYLPQRSQEALIRSEFLGMARGNMLSKIV